MATNIAPRNFDTARFNLTGAGETAITLPANVIRFMTIQCITSNDVYLTFDVGGTWSADNFWTIKSGQVLALEDVAIQPQEVAAAGGGTFFWMRGSATVTIEVIFAQG